MEPARCAPLSATSSSTAAPSPPLDDMEVFRNPPDSPQGLATVMDKINISMLAPPAVPALMVVAPPLTGTPPAPAVNDAAAASHLAAALPSTEATPVTARPDMSPPTASPAAAATHPVALNPEAPAAAAATHSAASVTSFVDSLKLQLQEPLIRTPPRTRRNDDDWIPRRSIRLAGKSHFRDPQPEKQARRVMLNKWAGRPDNASSGTPDAMIAVKFHDAFGASVSSSRREAMRALFPMRGSRWTRTAARLERAPLSSPSQTGSP
jgi:hypothetical protein